MKLLNVGCGAHFDPSWTNIDRVSSSPDVMACDIKTGLPFEDGTFDAVYHSHVIEHLTQSEGLAFLREGVRVMRPGATMRVVTPDLEGIVRLYLARLGSAEQGQRKAADEYDWILLELFDQMVRSAPGGDMRRYLVNASPALRPFIQSRIGAEASAFWDRPVPGPHRTRTFRWFLQKIGLYLSQARNGFAVNAATLIAGYETRRSFRIGLFRESGEVHQWLYDRFSLPRLMSAAGLSDVRVCTAAESSIPDFSRYGLDMVDGQARKPDSLFTEGIK